LISDKSDAHPISLVTVPNLTHTCSEVSTLNKR